MGYLHIENLYKAPEILECFALEKVHGTSAHVRVERATATHPVEVHFFAGGVSHAQFAKLFDGAKLREVFAAKFAGPACVTIYGEAFGGKSQGMSATYGKELRFLAFDVFLEDVSEKGVWLDVPAAAGIVAEFGLGFVPYERGPLTLAFLDAQRDRDSLVAVAPGKHREGIVIRGVRELFRKDGSRFIYKHKREEFRETATPREVDPEKARVLSEASAVAEEWVTSMRLQHVLDRTPYNSDKDTLAVIRAMQEDVRREAGDEVVWSRDVEKAVGRATVALLHKIPAQDAAGTEGK